MERRVYCHDVLTAIWEAGLTAQFEAWADLRYPDLPTYIHVLETISTGKGGMRYLYDMIKSGEFKTMISENS